MSNSFVPLIANKPIFSLPQIEGPGNFRKDVLDRTAEKLEFMAQRQGLYKFCFRTSSLITETVDFDVHIGHIPYYDQKVQDGKANSCCRKYVIVLRNY